MTFEYLLKKMKETPKGKSMVIKIYNRPECSCDECEKDTHYVYPHKSEKIDNKIVGICCKDADGYRHTIYKEDMEKISEVKYMDKKIARKLDKVKEDKKPKTKTKHIGVEMEFISRLDFDEMRELLAKNDLENYVTSKSDGSIDGTDEHPYEHELCILATERIIGKIVKKVCDLIRRHSDVNSSCGLHVHLDMRNRDVDKAYANLWAAQPMLYAMCPKSRIKNSFCRPVEEYKPVLVDRHEDRYVGVNRDAYMRHKTLEIRIHSSTLNATKINNWIKLLTTIANSKDEDYPTSMWRDLVETKKKVKLTHNIETYVKERIGKFKEEHKESKLKFAA